MGEVQAKNRAKGKIKNKQTLLPEGLRRQGPVLVEGVGADHRDELEVLGPLFFFFDFFFNFLIF